jgi:hypothetical protein
LTKKKINKEFFFSHLLDVLVCPWKFQKYPPRYLSSELSGCKI